MTAEVYEVGKVTEFKTLEEAKEYAKNSVNGYDIWVGQDLKQSAIKNFKTGEFTTVIFNN